MLSAKLYSTAHDIVAPLVNVNVNRKNVCVDVNFS